MQGLIGFELGLSLVKLINMRLQIYLNPMQNLSDAPEPCGYVQMVVGLVVSPCDDHRSRNGDPSKTCDCIHASSRVTLIFAIVVEIAKRMQQHLVTVGIRSASVKSA